jgi:hypothetical protein
MVSRIIVRVELTREAKAQLDKACEDLGMTQFSLVSRVLEWFGRQDGTTQRIIAGQVPPELAKSLSRLFAKNNRGEGVPRP